MENDFRRSIGMKTLFDPTEFGMPPDASRDDVIKAHYGSGAMNGRVYLLVQERERDREIAKLEEKAKKGDLKAISKLADIRSKERPGDRMSTIDVRTTYDDL